MSRIAILLLLFTAIPASAIHCPLTDECTGFPLRVAKPDVPGAWDDLVEQALERIAAEPPEDHTQDQVRIPEAPSFLSRMFGGEQPRNWQDDPTFDMEAFLDDYPDQLAVIQPLLDRANPTSPVLDNALETLLDTRSEGEARHVIAQIADGQRRLGRKFDIVQLQALKVAKADARAIWCDIEQYYLGNCSASKLKRQREPGGVHDYDLNAAQMYVEFVVGQVRARLAGRIPPPSSNHITFQHTIKQPRAREQPRARNDTEANQRAFWCDVQEYYLGACPASKHRRPQGQPVESLRDSTVAYERARIAIEAIADPQARPGIPNDLPAKWKPPSFMERVSCFVGQPQFMTMCFTLWRS